MDEEEIEADSIILKLEDGREFELSYRKEEDVACVSINRGLMIINPRAANMIYLDTDKKTPKPKQKTKKEIDVDQAGYLAMMRSR